MSQQSASFTVTVQPGTPPPPPLTLTPNGGNLPDETVGVADQGDVVCVVSGGTAPYSFSISAGSKPPGMDLVSTQNPDGSETITIEGTPTQSGAYSFVLTVTDSAGTSSSQAVSRKIG